MNFLRKTFQMATAPVIKIVNPVAEYLAKEPSLPQLFKSNAPQHLYINKAPVRLDNNTYCINEDDVFHPKHIVCGDQVLSRQKLSKLTSNEGLYILFANNTGLCQFIEFMGKFLGDGLPSEEIIDVTPLMPIFEQYLVLDGRTGGIAIHNDDDIENKIPQPNIQGIRWYVTRYSWYLMHRSYDEKNKQYADYIQNPENAQLIKQLIDSSLVSFDTEIRILAEQIQSTQNKYPETNPSYNNNSAEHNF